MAKEIIVKIKVDDNDLSRAKDKEAMLNSFSNLTQEYQQLMTEIMNNPKALKGLYDNKKMLLSMIS